MAQRSQNIGIVLSFLKLNAETMANAVLRMDAEVCPPPFHFNDVGEVCGFGRTPNPPVPLVLQIL